MDPVASPMIKAATNEYFLLAFRVGTLLLGGAGSLIGVLIMVGVGDIRSATAEVKKEVGDLRMQMATNRLEDANRLGKVEGQVVQLTGSVEAHRRRLDSTDNDIRSLWTRLYEIRDRFTQPVKP